MVKHPVIVCFILMLLAQAISAQDISELLDELTENSTDYAVATFKSTRIVSGHSIERMKARQLDFRISHRFGPVSGGAYEFFGMDYSSIRLGLEYGFTDWLMAGIGRGSYQKTYDGFMKFTILRQSTGKKKNPVSLSYLSTVALNTEKWSGPGELPFWDRASYVHQLLIARKFSERLSLEMNPTFVHRNLVETELDPNDLLAVGAGGRFKLTKRIAINAEYYYVIQPLHDHQSSSTFNPLSVGFDIETGGHVFQVHLTNSTAMIEKAFIGETTGSWLDGDIRVGFNISRVFTL